MSELMEDGEDSSMPESVEVSEGEGSYQEDKDVSRMGTDPEEDSSVEQQIADGDKLSEREDPAIQNPEVEHSKGILVPEDDEASRLRDADELEQEAFGSAFVSNNGDHPESVSSDKLSPKVDEGPSVEEKEILESGSENKQVLPEIADGLSQPPDTGTEDLDSVDLSDMLDPKLIAFEVIDFDQFGPQPPDLSLSDSLNNEEVEMMVNQYGGIDSPDGERGASESTEVMKPEVQITDIIIDNADNGVEQEMKTLNDDPVKDTSEREQLQKERDPDMDSYRIVPNRIKELQSEDNLPSLSFGGAEDDEGHEVPNSKPAAEREVEGPSGSEEIQKRAEELNQLTQEQARQLEDIRRQAELSTAQLEEQSKIHELKRELEAEYDERLKSEAKLMVLDEMLPNMEEKLKNLSNQVLSLKVLLQEQVDLRNKLLEDLQQESKERMQYVTQLEEQIDLKNKLAETLEQERAEKMQYIAQLEEQTRLHEELVHKVDEERDKWLKSEADLAVLREILSNTEEKLSNTEDKLFNAEEKLSNTDKKLANAEDKLFNAEEKLFNAEEELKDLRDQVESLAAQLQEQTEEELRKGLEEKLDWESKDRMQYMTKLEEQTKNHDELALKLEEERHERLKSETNLEELRESLSTKEEELNALQNQVVSLTTQVQEQSELKKELEDKLDQERNERVQAAVMVSDHSSESLPVSSMPWSEEKLELAKLLDEQKALLANQVLEAEKLKDAAQMKVGMLNDQVQNLEALTDIAETMEHVFNAKERAIKQALWTVFQAVCLGMGFIYFVVAYKDPLRSSLQPT